MELDYPAWRYEGFFIQSRYIGRAAGAFLHLEASCVKQVKFFLFGNGFTDNPRGMLQQVCRVFLADMKLFSERLDKFFRIQWFKVNRLIQMAIIRKKREKSKKSFKFMVSRRNYIFCQNRNHL